MGEGHLIGDEWYCQDCVDELFNYCDSCGEYTSDEVTKIYELVRGSDDKIKCWEHNKICENCLGVYETSGTVIFDERVNEYFWLGGNGWDRNEYINPHSLSDDEMRQFFEVPIAKTEEVGIIDF